MGNYYDILEVKRDASINDIKKSYRKLALKYHPDKNPGDTIAENKFKEINNAFEIIGNEEKRTELTKDIGKWKAQTEMANEIELQIKIFDS